MSTLLFSICLEKVVRHLVSINTGGTIRNRCSQCIAYAGDIVHVTTNEQALEEAYTAQEHDSTNLGQQVNSQKTKFMLIKKNVREEIVPEIKVSGSEFERVGIFRYLGSS